MGPTGVGPYGLAWDGDRAWPGKGTGTGPGTGTLPGPGQTFKGTKGAL